MLVPDAGIASFGGYEGPNKNCNPRYGNYYALRSEQPAEVVGVHIEEGQLSKPKYDEADCQKIRSCSW